MRCQPVFFENLHLSSFPISLTELFSRSRIKSVSNGSSTSISNPISSRIGGLSQDSKTPLFACYDSMTPT